jgi:hypothetical protein
LLAILVGHRVAGELAIAWQAAGCATRQAESHIRMTTFNTSPHAATGEMEIFEANHQVESVKNNGLR